MVPASCTSSGCSQGRDTRALLAGVRTLRPLGSSHQGSCIAPVLCVIPLCRPNLSGHFLSPALLARPGCPALSFDLLDLYGRGAFSVDALDLVDVPLEAPSSPVVRDPEDDRRALRKQVQRPSGRFLEAPSELLSFAHEGV